MCLGVGIEAEYLILLSAPRIENQICYIFLKLFSFLNFLISTTKQLICNECSVFSDKVNYTPLNV